MNAAKLIIALKKKFAVTTDRALARRLGMTPLALLHWQRQKSLTVRRIANAIDKSPKKAIEGFWHETYLMQGGMEAIYDDVPDAIGFMRFAPVQAARGTMFGATHRVAQGDGGDPVVSEQELFRP